MERKVPIHLEDAGLEIPAQRITTCCEWEDVALDPAIRQQVEDIVSRAEALSPAGFRAVFQGPSGTGKALTACLLSREARRPVVRLDLAAIVAQWADGTEKNLIDLFEQAGRQGWILYFDEADALFAKRTAGHDANDRAANQQISFLLQRIEDFPGIIILATHLRSHLDEDFARRFQAFIQFHLPDAG